MHHGPFPCNEAPGPILPLDAAFGVLDEQLVRIHVSEGSTTFPLQVPTQHPVSD